MTLSAFQNIRILTFGVTGSAANVLRASGSTEKNVRAPRNEGLGVRAPQKNSQSSWAPATPSQLGPCNMYCTIHLCSLRYVILFIINSYFISILVQVRNVQWCKFHYLKSLLSKVQKSIGSDLPVSYSAAKQFPDLCAVLFAYWKLLGLLLFFLLSGSSIKEAQRGH